MIIYRELLYNSLSLLPLHIRSFLIQVSKLRSSYVVSGKFINCIHTLVSPGISFPHKDVVHVVNDMFTQHQGSVPGWSVMLIYCVYIILTLSIQLPATTYVAE